MAVWKIHVSVGKGAKELSVEYIENFRKKSI